MIYLVAYDLNHESVRPDIVGEVKKTNWAMLSESAYAIETDETSSEVLARMREHIDQNDNCYVIRLGMPWDGYGPKPVIDWLHSKLF
jgi:CRISPR/Cas system-associated endoribonuclease Cas2